MGFFFGKLLITMAVFCPVFIIVRLLYVRRMDVKTRMVREICLGLFVSFMAGLVVLVTRPPSGFSVWQNPLPILWQRIATGKDINIRPFYTIHGFFEKGFSPRFVINIIANVLMFSPLGFFMPLLWKRWQNAYKMLLVGLCFSISIELMQLFIGRSSDIDDVILNTSGVLLGYLLYKLAVFVLPGTDTLSRQANIIKSK